MRVLIKKSTLKDIADAIREQDGDNSPIKPVDFPERITNILTGPAPEEIIIHNLGEITSMTPETTVALQVQIMPNCAKQVYTVVSSNPEVASVSQDPDTKIWSVTSVAEGEAAITITAGRISQQIQLNVVNARPVDPENVDFDNLTAVLNTPNPEEFLPLNTALKIQYGKYVMPFVVVGFQPIQHWNGTAYETRKAINLLALYTSETDSIWGGVNDTYSNSRLRSYITTTYQDKLDANFLTYLANTKVQSYNRDGSTDIVNDKLFAPSMAELGVPEGTYNTAAQNAVEGGPFTTMEGSSNAQRTKYKVEDPTSAYYYWTRSITVSTAKDCGFMGYAGVPGRVTSINPYRVVTACNFIGKTT